MPLLKNENQIMFARVTAKNVRDPFFETQCTFTPENSYMHN